MGGKSGGGFDAGPMIEYGDKALALQKKIYGDSVDRTEPFYEGGLGALDMLLDGLGVQGGSVKSRDQLYDSMKDNYTTTTTSNVGDFFVTPDGEVMSLQGAANDFGSRHKLPFMAQQIGLNPSDDEISKFLLGRGYKRQQNSQTTTDFDALNMAVDEAYAAQGEKPEGFGSLLESFDMDKFQADPGYNFRLEEGNKAIERAAAARGQYYDPSTVKSLTDYNSNMADQTYGDAYNRYNNDQNSLFNRLAAVSGIGQTANNSLVQGGQNYANQAGNIYGQMGSAQVEANAANASAPSMFDSLLGVGAQLGGAALANPAIFMSDMRMKENIIKDGTDNGHQMYTFNYKGNDKRYRGVMAQEALKTDPEAVVSIGGVLHVDYGRLGVEMTEA